MPKHCKTCSCTAPPEVDLSLPAKRWLLHYGDGMSYAEIGVLTGAMSHIVALQIRSIDSAVLRLQLRSASGMPGWFKGLAYAGCFDGIRRNGVLSGNATATSVMIPVS